MANPLPFRQAILEDLGDDELRVLHGFGLLTKMIDEAGLTGRFRSFLNKRLAKVA